MSSQHKFSRYFGFTDEEVDMFYDRYLSMTPTPNVTREGLRNWYDGYLVRAKTSAGETTERMYNPRSVVFALTNDQLADYWTSSGPWRS